MIRIFVSVGIVGGLIVAYLTTLAVGPISQLPPPESLLTEFRARGDVPENVNLEIDETSEDIGVFEVPEGDDEHLKTAEAAYEKMTSGMDMGGSMNMGSSDGPMNMASDGGDMETDSGSMNMASGGSSMEANDGNMNADSGDSGDMNAEGGNMNMASDSGNMDANGGNRNADSGNMNMAQGDNAGMNMDNSGSGDMGMGEGGLMVSEDGPYDREITLTMSEWKFSEMKIDVKMGERIKFTVRNGGQIPHEFMFMSPSLMNAVTYRATRADWNLFEHEALYERALVLPGGEFSFVLQVQQPGSWMFMCMLPYHMKMGMMGQMATEGMAMDM